MKKVSVVIPVHNSHKHIEECLNSVINQTYKNLEIVVVDDLSTDNTVQIIEGLKDNRIKIIKLEENVGAAVARNIGVDNSSGEYICYIDSDDYWVEDKVEREVKLMEENDYTFVYGGYAYLKNGKTKKARVPSSVNYNQLLKNHTIFTSTVMLNMEHLKKEDIYMPNIRRGQDMATWWQVLKPGITAYGITDTIAIYRVGENSLSSNKFKALKRTWNIFKREDLGIFKRLYCYLCYIYYAIKRRLSL
ncbi:MAG: glycosyltransferase family 2 protein [Clostridia bacterium]|nr:glycosyltransferase family 2 protein [Clostridia bacterium]